jgi:rare lipoprotein A
MKNLIIMFITFTVLILNVSNKQVKASSVWEETMETEVSETKTGIASFYHNRFVGRKTANGEIFSNMKYTCASNKFKLGSYLKVTNLKNGKIVYVKVNDRMAHNGRLIDLSRRSASDLNFVNSGLTSVKVEQVNPTEAKRKILAQLDGIFEADENML